MTALAAYPSPCTDVLKTFKIPSVHQKIPILLKYNALASSTVASLAETNNIDNVLPKKNNIIPAIAP